MVTGQGPSHQAGPSYRAGPSHLEGPSRLAASALPPEALPQQDFHFFPVRGHAVLRPTLWPFSPQGAPSGPTAPSATWMAAAAAAQGFRV